jgi:hypothetical protein
MFAGFGAADITPPIGSMLDGFIARLAPSNEVDLPLCARALWLDDSRTACLMVSLDVLGLTPLFADRVVSELAARLGLPEDHVVLVSSHTHSGPMTAAMRGLGPADDAYLSFLAERIQTAAVAAVAGRRSVRVAWGSAPVDIGVNRRQVNVTDGSVILGRNDAGPRDRVVRVMHLRGEGQSIVVMAHACHPYVLGGDSTLVSPDFWGHAAAVLSGNGHQAFYLNGCCGDIGPREAFRGLRAVRREGEVLASAVLRACGHATTDASADLDVGSARLELPHDHLPPMNEIEADLEKADQTVRDEERCNTAIQTRVRTAWHEWVSELRQATRGGLPLPSIQARVSVIRIGGGAIVVLPGEVFFEIGERLASRVAATPVWVAGYGHGYIGYIPTAEAYAEGGYEVEEAHRYLGMWRVAPKAGVLLTRQAIDLWRQIGGKAS